MRREWKGDVRNQNQVRRSRRDLESEYQSTFSPSIREKVISKPPLIVIIIFIINIRVILMIASSCHHLVVVMSLNFYDRRKHERQTLTTAPQINCSLLCLIITGPPDVNGSWWCRWCCNILKQVRDDDQDEKEPVAPRSIMLLKLNNMVSVFETSWHDFSSEVYKEAKTMI